MTFVSAIMAVGCPGVSMKWVGGGHPGENVFGHLDLLNLNCLETNCLSESLTDLILGCRVRGPG